MRTVFINVLMLTAFCLLGAGRSSAQTSLLDRYIDSAWASSLVLQQKTISLEKAKTGLAVARSYFLPEVNFIAGYQTAGGGRAIELPLGDLLNNAYSTLNQLTGTNQFPQLSNQSVNFFPRDFHDMKIRSSYSIYNPDIRYGRELAEKQIVLSELDVAIYKRELALAVKTAYYNYLSALEAVRIYENTLELAAEGKRVNQRLLDNGKGLHAYVLRSDSEVEQVKAAISRAKQQERNAALYFNFLLNRSPDAAILTEFDVQAELAKWAGQAPDTMSTTTTREELKALDQGVSIRETLLAQSRAVRLPRLGSFLDIGNQAEHWRFNSQSRYYLLGLQLELPLFTGQRNKNKWKQARLDLQAAALDAEQGSRQIRLASSTARNNLIAAYDQLRASERQLESAATYQRLIDRGYREGAQSFIETVDARNQLTQAQIQLTINQYKALIAAAEMERQLAGYPLN